MPPKGTNSSKTAHVMNLLRKSGPTEAPAKPTAEEVAPAVAAPAPAPIPAPAASTSVQVSAPEQAAPRSKHPILTELNADAAVSSKIKDALEDALESELLSEEAAAPVSPPDMLSVSSPALDTAAAASSSADETISVPSSPVPEAISEAPVISVPVAEAPASSGRLSQEEIERMLSAMAAEEETPAPAVQAPVAPAPVAEAPASSGRLSQEEIENMLRAMVDAEEGRAPVSAAAPVSVEEPAPKPAEPEPIPEPVAPVEPEPVSPPQPAVPAEPEDQAELFNIMQLLAEEKADKYIKLFGLCDCQRCRQDVLALTLNEISTKYVVMPRAELTVRNDMYRSHYDGELTVHILRACQKVMENPRHKK